MRHFIAQLRCKNAKSGNIYGAAINNIESDFHHPQKNRHGNITLPAQDSVRVACAPYPETATDHLDGVIADHRSSARCAQRAAVPKQTAGGVVRTVLPRDHFILWHLNATADLAAQIDDLKHLANDHIPLSQFKGRTHAEHRLTWWTFDGGLPSSAEAYVEELALPEQTIEAANRCGGIIEVEIPSEIVPNAFHKPSSLDGFGPETPFVPDNSPNPWGITAPKKSGFQGRKELVTESFAYASLASGTGATTISALKITHLQFNVSAAPASVSASAGGPAAP